MFVCNYDRKKFVDDYRQKYVEITKKCLWIEIADERLRFLQTKHLQCNPGLLVCKKELPSLKGHLKRRSLMNVLKQNHDWEEKKFLLCSKPAQ